MNCLVTDAIVDVLLILPDDVLHERDPGHDLGNGVAWRELVHLELPP